jgi:hypothetical protein
MFKALLTVDVAAYGQHLQARPKLQLFSPINHKLNEEVNNRRCSVIVTGRPSGSLGDWPSP